ncbi:MAG TPA: ribbon-helix-helix protein, CopG family [Micromonosporaceae bacterium]|nr:ribbon-helix-helix protein, CopG family [Micromonosporaceae bacterium]
MVQVDEQGAPVMRPATFRLPPSMLEWLEHAAGRDREGKSGIVRRALQEYRDRHHGTAA